MCSASLISKASSYTSRLMIYNFITVCLVIVMLTVRFGSRFILGWHQTGYDLIHVKVQSLGVMIDQCWSRILNSLFESRTTNSVDSVPSEVQCQSCHSLVRLLILSRLVYCNGLLYRSHAEVIDSLNWMAFWCAADTELTILALLWGSNRLTSRQIHACSRFTAWKDWSPMFVGLLHSSWHSIICNPLNLARYLCVTQLNDMLLP